LSSSNRLTTDRMCSAGDCLSIRYLYPEQPTRRGHSLLNSYSLGYIRPTLRPRLGLVLLFSLNSTPVGIGCGKSARISVRVVMSRTIYRLIVSRIKFLGCSRSFASGAWHYDPHRDRSQPWSRGYPDQTVVPAGGAAPPSSVGMNNVGSLDRTGDRMQPCYFRKSCVRIAGTANNLITHLAENHVLTVPCSQSAPLFRFYVSCPKKHAMTTRGSHSAM